MQKVQLTDDENRLYLLFQLKQAEEQHEIHKTNEETLLAQAGGDAPEELLGTFLHVERSAQRELDRTHASIKSRLDKIKPTQAVTPVKSATPAQPANPTP